MRRSVPTYAPIMTGARTGRRYRAGTLIAAALLSVVSACGGSSGQVVRPPETAVPTATPTPTPVQTTAAPKHQSAVAHPATGLVEGQSITVTGQGFSPGKGLVVVECLDRGTATGAGDCNMSALVSAQADAHGNVTARLKVSKGPFGNPPVLCSKAHPCLVSVTEATLSPTEEADAPISFR